MIIHSIERVDYEAKYRADLAIQQELEEAYETITMGMSEDLVYEMYWPVVVITGTTIPNTLLATKG